MASARCHVQLPSMVDDDSLDSTARHVERDPGTTFMAFFVHSIELFDIINNALKAIYHCSPTDRHSEHNILHWWSREQLGRILPLNHTLDDLSTKLPAYLHPECNVQETDRALEESPKWQGYVFRCRYQSFNPLLIEMGL